MSAARTGYPRRVVPSLILTTALSPAAQHTAALHTAGLHTATAHATVHGAALDPGALLGMPALTTGTFILLLAAALLAGWVDAVVGGGGLIQLPAILLVPGLAPVHAIATNKVSSCLGTAAAALTYRRRVGFPSGVAPAAALAFLGSMAGALLATRLPTEVFTPIVIAALAVVLLITVARPSAFSAERSGVPALPHRTAILRGCAIGAVVGVYDGVMGPGTGSFLVLGFILLVGLDTLRATAMTKAVNLATNLGALVLFAVAGVVEWRLGLVIGLANMTGGWLGARTATRFGPRFVRVVLIVVVLALLAKLITQELG